MTNFQNLIGKYDNMINFLVPSCTKIKSLAIFGTFVIFFCALLWSECDQAWHGFSVNKDLLVVNLREQSLIGQRLVYDNLTSLDTYIYENVIPDNLVKSSKLA